MIVLSPTPPEKEFRRNDLLLMNSTPTGLISSNKTSAGNSTLLRSQKLRVALGVSASPGRASVSLGRARAGMSLRSVDVSRARGRASVSSRSVGVSPWGRVLKPDPTGNTTHVIRVADGIECPDEPAGCLTPAQARPGASPKIPSPILLRSPFLPSPVPLLKKPPACCADGAGPGSPCKPPPRRQMPVPTR